MNIRKLIPEDADQFYELKRKGLQTDPNAFLATAEEMNSKTPEEIRAWIERDYIFGAFIDEKLVGTIHLIEQQPKKFQHIGILGGMYVDPEYRGRGIARQLLQKMLEHIKNERNFYSLQLKVVTTNMGALKLYESFGFFRWAHEQKALYYNGKYTDQYHYMLVL